MEDHQIIDLYWQRDPQAIPASDTKYGGYCATVARNILPDGRDVEETLSDTWLGAWQTIPPQRPGVLRIFFGRITRNLALNRWQRQHAQKRGGGELPLALEELEETLPAAGTVEQAVDAAALEAAVDAFLRTLPRRECSVFLRRYWFTDSHREIARRFGLTEANVAVMLSRTRKKLRLYLQSQGWTA